MFYKFLSFFLLITVKASVIEELSDVTAWKLDSLSNNECKNSLEEYINALADFSNADNFWALQMLDSSAKLPNGILELNSVQMGMFQECLSIRDPRKTFQGKHCMLEIFLNADKIAQFFGNGLKSHKIQQFQSNNTEISASTLIFKYGVCLPSTCYATDLNEMFEALLPVKAKEENCWQENQIELTDLAVSFICVCSVLAGIVAFSTAYHYLRLAANKKPNRLLCAFSLKLTVPNLLQIRKNDGNNMECLHGIRTLSMAWVVLCHTYEQQLSNPVMNIRKMETFMTSNDYILVSNGYYSVDSFFFLSGLLVAFVFFRNVAKNGGYDALVSYIHRFIRLTPSYAMMIYATVALLPVAGYGPIYHDTVTILVQRCRDHWWTALLYLQNYLNSDGLCMGQTWYLSIDMQLFWLAPLVLYPVLFWPTFGSIFVGLLTIASAVWTFVIAYQKEYKASVYLNPDGTQFNYEYIVTHMRMMPYLVGVFCAVILAGLKARKIQVRLGKLSVLLGWCMSAAICLGVLFSLNRFETDAEAPAVESALYLAFARLGWAVGLAWIVFACVYGYGGLVNSFLSSGIWQPLGKLSYGVYLIHITVLSYKTATLQTNILVSDLNVVYEYLATLIFSYLFAFLLYITVEAPFMVMDQEIIGNVKIFQYPRPKKITETQVP